MNSKMLQAKAPISSPRTEFEVTHLLRQYTQGLFDNILAVVEVKPLEQTHISLGNYDSNHRPQSFALKLHPNQKDDELVAQITKLELENGEYELVLHVANYSNKIISIEVWQP